jgi:hypothetical protein
VPEGILCAGQHGLHGLHGGHQKRCGFTTIESEWWHFSDADCMDYLRTDYDLNAVPRVICG